MVKQTFTFEISLSVLNYLGRHLYRSFATVLGEAISNSWDADARNVWIYIDKDKNGFWIKDDGVGMDADDFQNKFLRIGYSKRQEGDRSPKRGRPFIGRKGIGKLALLSCADRISVISKTTKEVEYIGGVIDNQGLDDAIKRDLAPDQYSLSPVKAVAFAKYTKDHKHGTIIRFEQLKEGIKHSFTHLGTLIALYFRFSLVDKSFRIYLNDEIITHKHVRKLLEKTQFLWRIGALDDPFVLELKKTFTDSKDHNTKSIAIAGCTGFVASVTQPRDLKILATDERVGVDLFVNGRLRERDLLKHAPTARIVESYLYGQIHFDDLDDNVDRFTSSREGVVADDPKFAKFLERFKKALASIAQDWDEWRVAIREPGDTENESISKSQRAANDLYGAVTRPFEPPKGSKYSSMVDEWIAALSADAAFNFESYAECFIAENLIRKFINEKEFELFNKAKEEINKWKKIESKNKENGNISIDIRKSESDLTYLGMNDLAFLVDKRDRATQASLSRDALEYKPMRDAVAHTALLTDQAKAKLTSVRENIRARVKKLLS